MSAWFGTLRQIHNTRTPFVRSALSLTTAFTVCWTVSLTGCGDDDTTLCGDGTTLVDGRCVAAGGNVSCGDGTELVDGVCVAIAGNISCGEGTELVGGECLPSEEVELLTFELTEEASGYDELVEDLISFGAADSDNHLDQSVLADWADAGPTADQIQFIFDHGDELTEIEFREADGVGSLSMPDDTALPSRFTRTPTGTRFTGPNATACLSCHNNPIGNAGGLNVVNVMQDPAPGIDGLFNVRQTISINGGGAIQILAEDMTEELQALRDQAKANPGTEIELLVKEGAVSFGSIICASADECNYEDVVGISPDLIVRPMGWKGNFPTLRGFSSDAGFGEMGMQSDEILWKLETPPFSDLTPDIDGDGDGITHELSVGDITALTVYLAMQEIPTTVIALADADLAELSAEDRSKIVAGEALFDSIGCADCHVSSYKVSTTMFAEPSARANGAFEDLDLAGRNVGYTSDSPLVVDLSAAPTDEPRLLKEQDGSAEIQPYTDLKRHFMGAHLADDAKTYFPKDASQFDITELPEDADADSQNALSTEIGLGEFLTPELWGVGNSGPWLHDGRALTLSEAILLHGVDNPGANPSEAQAARDAFQDLNDNEKEQVIAFLRNLVLVDMADEEEEE